MAHPNLFTMFEALPQEKQDILEGKIIKTFLNEAILESRTLGELRENLEQHGLKDLLLELSPEYIRNILTTGTEGTHVRLQGHAVPIRQQVRREGTRKEQVYSLLLQKDGLGPTKIGQEIGIKAKHAGVVLQGLKQEGRAYAFPQGHWHARA